jgi:glutamine amidotransferase
MSVVVIDYGSGNLRSVTKALERAASEGGINTDIVLTSDPEIVANADHIILPGVGTFKDCKQGLESSTGMIQALELRVIEKARPFLGICVGMQLMADFGSEHGIHQGLGWIKGAVEPITPKDPSLKIPHMGWNEIFCKNDLWHPVLDRLPKNAHAYFVHSYHMKADNPEEVLAKTDHGGEITAVVGRDNLIGTQFHPEKSQEMGLAFLTNFLRWRP